jgi:hypothetical protein
MVPEKAPARLLHITYNAADTLPEFNQATDWPHFNFNVINSEPRNSENKNRAETRSRYGATFLPFSLCPLCECLPYASIPSTPVPNQHCSNVDIYNAYILKQRSIGANSEMYFFPAKVGANYAPGPTQPPRMPNS